MTDWSTRHPDPFGVKARDTNAVINAGHPPVAERVALVDFDGTIFPFGGLNDPNVHPLPGAVESILELHKRGFDIVIFTSRMSRRWWVSEVGIDAADAFGAEQYEYVASTLEKWGIPYNEITAEKVPAEAYFDDKAWRVNAYMSLRECVIAFLASKGEVRRKGDISW